MEIKILWTWCSSCKRLELNTVEAVKQLWINVEIQKITEVSEIMSYNVFSTPCLVVDEKVVLQWKVLNVEDIKSLLSNIK